MERISQRAGAIAESMTMAITARAAQLKADGVDVIGFGAGEPDFPTPPHIVAAAAEAAAKPRFHRYSPVAGLPELREAIAERYRGRGWDVEPSNVVVTNGAKHAVFQALSTLLDPGDEVLMQSPYWVTYPEAVSFAGGKPVPIATTAADGFKFSVDQLSKAVTARTKVLLFASPQNPTGTVYTSDEIRELAEWADRQGIWVVSDDIYDEFVYEPHTFSSVLDATPSVADRTVVCNAVSKTYAMTGWRVGWCVAPADIAAAAVSIQSHTTSNVSNVAQAAALAALTGDQSSVPEMRAAFDRRRKSMVDGLSSVPGLICPEPQGAFYVFPEAHGVLGRPVGRWNPQTTLELAEALLEEAKVAVVPGEPFAAAGHIRLSYALADDELVEGLARLAKAVG